MLKKTKYQWITIISITILSGLIGLAIDISFDTAYMMFGFGLVAFWVSIIITTFLFDKAGMPKECKHCINYKLNAIYTGAHTYHEFPTCNNPIVMKNGKCPYNTSIKLIICRGYATIEGYQDNKNNSLNSGHQYYNPNDNAKKVIQEEQKLQKDKKYLENQLSRYGYQYNNSLSLEKNKYFYKKVELYDDNVKDANYKILIANRKLGLNIETKSLIELLDCESSVEEYIDYIEGTLSKIVEIKKYPILFKNDFFITFLNNNSIKETIYIQDIKNNNQIEYDKNFLTVYENWNGEETAYELKLNA